MSNIERTVKNIGLLFLLNFAVNVQADVPMEEIERYENDFKRCVQGEAIVAPHFFDGWFLAHRVLGKSTSGDCRVLLTVSNPIEDYSESYLCIMNPKKDYMEQLSDMMNSNFQMCSTN